MNSSWRARDFITGSTPASLDKLRRLPRALAVEGQGGRIVPHHEGWKPLLPAAKLMVFSGFGEFKYIRQATGMNVPEYILKPVNAPERIQTVEALVQ